MSSHVYVPSTALVTCASVSILPMRQGMYTGGRASEEASGLDPEERYGNFSQQFSPPDRLLLGAYQNAFAEANRLHAATVCCPALGVGVKGWKAAISAAFGAAVGGGG